jgi:hypothetical protein
MKNCFYILAGIYGILVRNESKMADGKIWIGALANLFTKLQHVTALPFGILEVLWFTTTIMLKQDIKSHRA